MNFSRRQFLKTSTAAALSFPAVVRAVTPNSMLQVAVVGCGGKGFSDLNEVGSHAKVKFVGFCDVDSTRFDKADQKFPGVPHFSDFRDMYQKLGETMDAVIVATPDHMHALPSIEAMKRGCHVYCEKPLSHSVWEARQMQLHAKKAGVATQMGNQIHSAAEYRTAVRLLRNEVIGKITAVHSWQKNPGNGYTKLTAPPASGPVPETLNWDAWLGVAAQRDYAPNVYHPFNWRDWQDFGGGTMGDFGCHILDPVFTALELTAPVTIRAENEGLNKHTWPTAETIAYIFPGTPYTAGPVLPLSWYDGGRKPNPRLAYLPEGEELPAAGSLFIGEGGQLVLPHVGMPKLYPVEKFGALEIEKVPGSNHYHAWVEAALGGAKTSDNFDYSGPLTEAVHLGNVATRFPEQKLKWDAAALKVTNLEEANRLLKREYRKGWEIEAI